MGSLKDAKRSLDPLPIKRNPDEPGTMSLKGRTDGTIADPVDVNLAFHIKAGMKERIDLTDLPNSDIGREKAVDPHQKISLAEAGGGVKMGDLSYGMDPRIRTARTDYPTLLAGHPADRLLDELLNGKPVLLTLPAAVGRAVIFDDQFNIPHLFISRAHLVDIHFYSYLPGAFSKRPVPPAPDSKTAQR